MKAKLRGHHLICLNFFRGEGYSEDFIDNIYNIIKIENLEVVAGPDDVCRKCPYIKDNECGSNEYSNEKILAQDWEALRLLQLAPGMIVSWNILAAKLPAILDEWKKKFCGSCGYKTVCFK